MNVARLEAFSDGVFAVAITLLVLDIKIPEHLPPTELTSHLVELLPRVGAYVLSFFVVGLYWSMHRMYLLGIRKADGTLVFLNLLMLLLVSFFPLPTSMLGSYPDSPTSLLVYGACLLATNLVAFLIVMHLDRHPEFLHKPDEKGYLRSRARIYMGVNLSYLLAILVAPYQPRVSYAMFLAVLVYAGIDHVRKLNRAARDGGAPAAH